MELTIEQTVPINKLSYCLNDTGFSDTCEGSFQASLLSGFSPDSEMLQGPLSHILIPALDCLLYCEAEVLMTLGTQDV